MQYCRQCGKPMEDGARFCTACGAKNEPTVHDMFGKVADTPDSTAQFDPADVQQNKVMAVLSYFGLLVLVPIFAAKDSRFARFHANQGLILFLASVLVEILSGIVSEWIGVLALLILALRVVGIVWAAQGKAKALPLIGSWRILQ